MKKLLAITILLLITLTNLNAQNKNYIDSNDIVDTYLGAMNGKNYFYNKNDAYLKDDTVSIFSKSGTEIIKEGELKVVEKQRILEIFLYNNSLYTITDDRADKIIKINLNKFDQNYQLIESRKMLETEYIAKQKILLQLKVIDGVVGMVCVMQDKTDQGIAYVCNLDDNTEATSMFTHPDLSKSKYADHIFNNQLQMEAIFEFPGKEETAILISSDKSTSKVKVFKTEQELTFCQHFKFGYVSEDEFVLGSIVFNEKGTSIAGYTLQKLDYGSANVPELKLILNAKFMDPELWSKNEYKKYTKSYHFENSASQHLKAIEMISEGQFLLVSESQYTLGGSYTIASPSGIGAPGSVSGAAGAPQMYHNTTYWAPTYNYLGDIIVSSVSLDGDVNWSNKTIGRQDYVRPFQKGNVNSPNFLLTISDSEVAAYFDLSSKLIDETGTATGENLGLTFNTNTHIVCLNTDLNSGKGKVKAIGKDPANLPNERLLPNTFFTTQNGKGYFMVYKSNGSAFQLKIKEERFVELD